MLTRESFIDNLLVRIHFIIEMIWWIGLAPWEFELSFPGSITSTFLDPFPTQERPMLPPSLLLSNLYYHPAYYRGTSLMKNNPPIKGHHRALGMSLL